MTIPGQHSEPSVCDMGASCSFKDLESGTVESHCSEGGIGDVAAARHTKDLQLVASSAQTDQAFICYLCARLHIDGGEFWAVFLKVFQSSVIQLCAASKEQSS